MPSKTPTSPQDASVGVDPTLPSPQPNEIPEGLDSYLHHLATKLTEWQQVVFNSAANEGNFTGLRVLSHDVQVAAYELRVMLGMGIIEAKVGAGMTLTPQEAEAVKTLFEAAVKDTQDQEDADRRAEAVRKHQEGLHHVPTTPMAFEAGRKADREDQ